MWGLLARAVPSIIGALVNKKSGGPVSVREFHERARKALNRKERCDEMSH